MKKYKLDELASLVQSTKMILELANRVDEEEGLLGYSKEEVEMMALRVANFIQDAEFTVTGGCV